MAIDADRPYSPGWWLLKLEKRLVNRRDGDPIRPWSRIGIDPQGRPPLRLLDAHLRGDPPLPPAAHNWRDGSREFLRKARMNYTEVIVDSVVPKLIPVGFRTSTAAGADRRGDQRAAALFEANDLALQFSDVASWMLGLGDGYMSVGPGIEDELPVIAAEHPFEVITADDPVTRRPRAALKLWRDEWDELERAQLHLPGQVLGARRTVKADGTGAKVWDWDDDLSMSLPPAMAGVIGIRRFGNRRGVGEFEPHLDVVERINDGIFDRLVISKHQAHRQQAVKGLPDTDEHGQKIDWSTVFTSDPGAFWSVEAGVEFWQSAPTDLTPLRMAIQDDVRALAAATSTALHLFAPEAAQGSAEGATLVRESGTWKASDRRRRCDKPLRDIMSLAFAFDGASAVPPTRLITLWEPVERFSLAERYDAAVKARSAGEPYESIAQNVLQYSPEDVDWQQQLRADEQLLAPVDPAAGQAALAAAGLAAPPTGPASV